MVMIEIKPGYKQTDLGIIPDDWEVDFLLNKVSFMHGKAHEKAICEDGEYIVVNSKFISSEAKVKKYSKANFCKAKIGDVLMVLSDLPNGKALAKCFHVQENNLYAVNQRVCVYRPKGLDSKFLYYVLNRKRFFLDLDDGVTQTHILNKDIEKCLVQFPRQLEEQKTIANALDDIGKLIGSLEDLIKKKRDIKFATMQELLTGKKRLPGFDDEWEEKKLKEIAPLQRGFDLTKSQIKEGNVPVAYSNGVMAYHNKAMVKGPGVYTGRSGTIGKVNFIASDYWPHNTSLWVTTFFKNDPKFIFFLYSFIDFNRFSSGSGVPTFNRNDAHDYICLLPQPSEQIEIAKILSDIDTEIDCMEKHLAKAKSLKKGMIQELLTGKKRLIKITNHKEITS